MADKVVHDSSVRWLSDAWIDELGKIPGDRCVEVIEIPFDYAVSHRPGARFGPAAIIEALNGFSLYCTDKRVDLSALRFKRSRTVSVSHDFPSTYSSIEQAAAALDHSTVPIFLGGDHSITDPILRGLLKHTSGRRIGLIVFDAHLDSRRPLPGREHSGHWMYTLRDVLDHTNTVQLGINAPIYSQHYMMEAERSGVLVLTPYEIRKKGWRNTIEEAVEHASADTDGVYVSVDIDCLDRAVAQGTSVPNGCGLMAYEVADALFEIACRISAVGLDVVEVSPPLDHSSDTATVAAHLIMNYLAGVVANRSHRVHP